MHCIWKWLETETAKGLCPMCRQPFNIDKNKEVNQGIRIPSSGRYQAENTSSGDLEDARDLGDADAASIDNFQTGNIQISSVGNLS